MNSSHIESTLKGRPSAVVSNIKSSAHTWLGRSACSRHAGTVLVPNLRRLGECGGTRNPSARQSRCTRLWFTFQPSIRSTAPARLKPHLGHVLEISRSRLRNSSSGAATGRGGRRWVALGWLAARHAWRSLVLKILIRCSTAARRLVGLRSFPGISP